MAKETGELTRAIDVDPVKEILLHIELKAEELGAKLFSVAIMNAIASISAKEVSWVTPDQGS